jgi:hypothetical protein
MRNSGENKENAPEFDCFSNPERLCFFIPQIVSVSGRIVSDAVHILPVHLCDNRFLR